MAIEYHTENTTRIAGDKVMEYVRALITLLSIVVIIVGVVVLVVLRNVWIPFLTF